MLRHIFEFQLGRNSDFAIILLERWEDKRGRRLTLSVSPTVSFDDGTNGPLNHDSNRRVSSIVTRALDRVTPTALDFDDFGLIDEQAVCVAL